MIKYIRGIFTEIHMRLRKLKKDDAPFMLEWMHDTDVVENMSTNFAHKTLENCLNFIELAQNEKENLHLAVTDDNDEYMGTVSLKNITETDAEFAITIRKLAMGKGYSKFGMSEIIRIGFEDKKLHDIYWCVSPKNKRAVRFYDKNGYQRTEPYEKCRGYSQEQLRNYIWYKIQR